MLALLLGGVVGLAALAVLAIVVVGGSEVGRARLAGWGSDALSAATGFTVRLSGLGPGLPTTLRLDRLSLADAAGVWLTVEAVQIAWRPAALLRGRLAVEVVAAERIDMPRLPIVPPPSDAAGEPLDLSIPEPPLDLRLDRLTLPQVALGEGVLGAPVTVAVTAQLGARVGEAITTALQVRRTDAGAGTLSLEARLLPAADQLDLDLRLEEAAGGLAVRLLDLAPYPPLTLTLQGDGPIGDWRGRLSLQAPGLLAGAADLGVRRIDEVHRLAAAGQVLWQGAVPTAIQPAVADGIRFEMAATRRTDGAVDLDALQVDGRALSLTGSGRLAADGSGFALQSTVALGPPALAADALAGWRFSRFSSEATIAGHLDRLAELTVSIAGELTDVAGAPLRAGRITWQGTAEQAAAGGRAIRLAVSAADVAAADPALRPLAGSAPTLLFTGRLDDDARQLAIDSLRLTTPAAVVSGAGRLDLAQGDSDLAFDLALDDLRRLVPLLGPGWAGQGRLQLRIAGPVLAGRGQGRLEAAASGLQSGEPLLQAALGARPSLVAAATLDPLRGLSVSGVTLTGAALTVTGDARLDPGFTTIEAAADLRVADLAPLAAAAGTTGKGPLRLSLTAGGRLADPGANLRLIADGIELAGQTLSRGTMTVDAEALATRPAGELRAAFVTGDGPVEARLRFLVDPEDVLRLDGITASLFGLQASGDLAVALGPGIIDGRLDVALPAGDAGLALAGNRLSGRGTGGVAFRPSAGRQEVALSFAGEALRLADAGGEMVRVRRLDLTARVGDAFATPRLDVRAIADGISAGDEGPLALRLDAAGPLAALAWQARLDGPADRLDWLTLRGQANLTGALLTLVVDRLDGRAGGQSLALVRPLTISSGEGRLALTGLDLAVGGGRVAGRLDLRPGDTDATLTIDRLPLALVHAWLPAAPPDGSLEARASLTTVGSLVTGEIAARIAGVRLAAGQLPPPPLAAELTATLGGAGADLRLRIGEAAGGDRLTLTAALALPLRLAPGRLDPVVDSGAPLAGEVRLVGDAAFLAETLALPDQRLAGSLRGQLRLAGSLDQPDATGDLLLADGLYENFVTGTLLAPLAGRILLERGRAATLALSGQTPGGGRLVVDGTGRLDAAGAPALDLRVELTEARLVARDDVTATLAGGLTYQGGLDRGRLAGRLAVTPVEVHLKDRLPPNVVVLPVIEINRPAGELPPAAPAPSRPTPQIALAIALDMPRRIFVRGRGLESEWTGTLDVGGSSTEPRLTGEISLVRGVFTFASKRFQLQRGIVSFFGGRTIDPLLDLAAEYRTPELTAVIAVRGPASDPALEVTSQPPLPQSEVLAQVMFGKATTRLSPFEAVQLTAALDALAGGDTWTEDALGSVRQFLGLDVLTVDSGSDGDKGPAVEVGRYLGDRVYVGARRGLTDDTSGGRVEVEILPGLSLQSDILQDIEGTTGSIGLRWKHDY